MAELAQSCHSSKYNTGKKWENYDREIIDREKYGGIP